MSPRAATIFRVEMLSVIARGKFSPGLNCIEKLSVGRRDFSMELELDFLVLLKMIRNEIKKSSVFN